VLPPTPVFTTRIGQITHNKKLDVGQQALLSDDVRSRILRSEPAEERHHWAPVGECRLNEIQSNKACEQQPVRAVKVPKEQTRNNEGARDQSQQSLYSHVSTSPKETLINRHVA
jgi:hypothetical protein